MFKQAVSGRSQGSSYNLPAPVRGLDAVTSLMEMREGNAVILENWFPDPTALITRPGYYAGTTGFTSPVRRLHTYSALNGGEVLFATCDNGIFNASADGAVGAAVTTLTEGNTIATQINTGAASYMMVVNGVDSLRQFDGSAWTTVTTFGSLATNNLSYVELYRQRLFFIQKNSLNLAYLAPNSISGSHTDYPLGAVFRKGGFLVALCTWTIDGGAGSQDNLAIISSKGEVAVYVGNDPATWELRGVYYIGIPLGPKCMQPYGGDVLVLTETGVIPLSSVVQSASIDRAQTFTQRIRPVFNAAALAFASLEGWEIIIDPLSPLVLVNIPSTPVRKQAVMHSQTGAWSTYTGWEALCWGRKGNELFFGTANAVRRVGGNSDNGANITATMSQAYSRLRSAADKMVTLVRPYLASTGGFTYNLGLANDFNSPREVSFINGTPGTTAALWGTAIFGEALWSGGDDILQEWQSVPDEYASWKSLYLQVITNNGRVTYVGSDLIYLIGGDF